MEDPILVTTLHLVLAGAADDMVAVAVDPTAFQADQWVAVAVVAGPA